MTYNILMPRRVVYALPPTEFSTFFERERKHRAAVISKAGIKLV